MDCPHPSTQVPYKTNKQMIISFLTEKGESVPKNITVNSLVERFYALYPDFFESMGMRPKANNNLLDHEPLSDFDESLDTYGKDECELIPSPQPVTESSTKAKGKAKELPEEQSLEERINQLEVLLADLVSQLSTSIKPEPQPQPAPKLKPERGDIEVQEDGSVHIHIHYGK